jgi:MFS family permease
VTREPPAGIGSLLADGSYLRIWLMGGLAGASRWLEMLALGIYAVEVTGSPFLVALLMILRLAPLALFGAMIGTLADRADRKLVLIASLVLVLAQSVVMLGLSWSGAVVYWHVAVAAFLSGMFWATDMPLRRRLIGDVAGPGRIAPAMSLDSATNNATRMVGPLLGGALYQWLGLSGVYGLNTVTYGLCLVLALGLLLHQDRDEDAGAPARATPLRDLADAFLYALRDKEFLRILAVTVVFNVWGFAFMSMIPVIGEAELGLAPGEIGALTSLEGVGAFLGAVAVAWLAGTSRLRFRRIYYFGTLAYLVLVFLVGWAPTVASTAAALVAVGLAGACFSSMQSTLTYVVAPPAMRSRMFGLLAICIGTGMIGSVNVGLMAELFGASAALQIIAVEGLVPLVLVGVGWRALRR